MNFWIIHLILILSVCTNISESGSPCPNSPLELLPCLCKKEAIDTMLICNYYDQTIMDSAMDVISSKKMIIDYFNISSIKLTTIGAFFFKDITIRKIEISGVNLNSVHRDAFKNQRHNLNELDIKRSVLTTVPVDAIRSLEELDNFCLSQSEVVRIENNLFDGLKSAGVLSVLDLQNNRINHIGNGAFKQLVALQFLYLSNNRLTHLQANILPSPSRISILNLGSNLLEEVIGDLAVLKKGATINMLKNKISILTSKDLVTIMQKDLDVLLYGNDMECSCSMRVLLSMIKHNIIGKCRLHKGGARKMIKSLKPSDFSHCAVLI